MNKIKRLLTKRILLLSLPITVAAILGASVFTQPQNTVQAADNNFTDGITVDSKGDGADANTADSICDDGSGNCTLRAAIEESNQEAGSQTIEFNITGPADFTNGAQSGYTIQPNSALPDITDTVTIDGYSQPGAQANLAAAPNPLNGVLLVEIDGVNAGINKSGIVINGPSGVQVRGLVIDNWDNAGIQIGGDNAEIYGNYIGTDYSGSVAKPNMGNGVDGWLSIGNNALIGGLDASERNLISGNSGAAMGIGYDHNNWQLLGNYIGVAADGVTALPNAQPGGSGNPSIDFVSGTIVGGLAPGSTNVISGNLGHGIAPHDSPNTQIIGNLIGTDYTGTVPLGNGVAGITISGNSSNSVISKNVIADSGIDDIFIQDIQNVLIAGNAIGTDITGTIDMGSGQGEILSDNSTGIIGGTAADDANIIRYGASGGISLYNGSNISILRNNIYSNSGLGIDLDFSGAAINDPNDSDTGSNDLLNFPTYDDYNESGGDTEVNYRLDVPAGDYRIEFFSNAAPDPSGNGEGEIYLGHHNITHPGGGEMSFSHVLSGVTGVTNLAMTNTERNVATTSGFGSTSEFGGQTPPNTDLAIEKDLLNPEDVAQGATLQYEVTITNQGWSPADLSSFATIGGGQPLFYDFAPTELTNAQPYLADGPLPGTSFIDVTNPDLTCLWADGGVGLYWNTSPYADYGMIVCWYTGANAELLPGNTITATFTLDLSSDSDLVFNNYAMVSALPNDPDSGSMALEITNVYGNSTPDFVIESTTGFNNIAVSRYPAPVDPEESVPGNTNDQGQNSGGLVKTGQEAYALILLVTLLISSVLALVVLTRRKA
jgi:hypothetical protein